MTLRQLLRSWLLPTALGVAIFAIGQPILANLLQQEERFRQYLTTETIEVGSEPVDGYQQVYYVYEEKKHFVTEGSSNSFSPVASGEYIAWVSSIDGAGQIFWHHIPSNTTVQLTHGNTNLSPSIHGSHIAWEGWVDNTWQVFLFDGVRTVQLTEGDLAVEPHVTEDGVLFARKDGAGTWRGERYPFGTQAIEFVEEGLTGKLTALRKEQEESTTQTTPTPLPPQATVVDEEEIRDELTASPESEKEESTPTPPPPD